MLTKAQFGKYRAAWADACASQCWLGKDECEVRRDALHALLQRTRRVPISRKDWTNAHFDIFLAECAKLSGTHHAKNTEDTASRKRLIWRIRDDAKLGGLAENYLQKISRDLTGLACWEELDLRQLENFRNRIHQLSRKKSAEKAEQKATPAPAPTRHPVSAFAHTFSPTAEARFAHAIDDDLVPF